DFHVTGVQTCALPISLFWLRTTLNGIVPSRDCIRLCSRYSSHLGFRARVATVRMPTPCMFAPRTFTYIPLPYWPREPWFRLKRQIGRASCRGRGVVSG